MENSKNHKVLSTSNVFELINKPDVTLIDVRSVNAYNGWRENGEQRGGHIQGARSLPYKWSKYIDWIEIVESKHMVPEDNIIVYGYAKNEIDFVAQQLSRAGYSDVNVYYDFMEWNVTSKPMENLTNYKHLVSPEWLNRLINFKIVAEYDNNKFVICHAHYRNPADYKEGHIPGAIAIDTNQLESQETWNRKSPKEIKKTLEKLGIAHDTTVIVYGRFSFPSSDDEFPGSSAGQIGAIRCALIMMYAGVKDVRVLNGGIHSWLDRGLGLTKENVQPKPIRNFGAEIPGRPELFIDLDEAQEYLRDADKNLVSIRSYREWIGEVSGYNYIKKKGRIPGAIFSDCGSDAYHMENYRNLDHTTLEYKEIAENLKKVGVTPDKYNAFYCGTGWRGSEAWFNAWLMGWPNVSVFDGGWFEWSNNNLPFETGKDDQKNTV